MKLAGKNYKIDEKTTLTIQYKIINEMANVPNKEILIPADTRTRSKHGHTFLQNDLKQIFILHTNHIPVELSTKSII